MAASQSTLEKKSSPSDGKLISSQTPQASNLTSFFAAKKAPSPMEIAAVSLIENYHDLKEAKELDSLEKAKELIEREFATIEKIAELIKKSANEKEFKEISAAIEKNLAEVIEKNKLGIKNKDQLLKFINSGLFAELKRETQIILTKIKTLHEYVEQNKVEEADKLLQETPAYQLPILFKMKSTIATSAKGLKNHMVVRGTALMMALGFEAVGRDGCDLYLMPANSHPENTAQKKLVLYKDDNPLSPFKYFVEGKEWRIENKMMEAGGKYITMSWDNYHTLTKMFDKIELYNQPLNLDHPTLNEAQRDAYAGLLKITELRRHTLFVNEEGMVEMLHRHIKRAMLDKGEQEIAIQTLAQFPDKWEQKDEKRYQEDFAALNKFRQATKVSKSDDDPELKDAKEQYINQLEPDPKQILETGLYGKTRLLLAAFEISRQDYERGIVKYNRQGVGWLQRLESTSCKHDMAQGSSQFDSGKKSNRKIDCLYGRGTLDLPDYEGGVGFYSWVDPYLGIDERYARGDLSFSWRSCEDWSKSFAKLCTNKNKRILEYIAAARQLLIKSSGHKP